MFLWRGTDYPNFGTCVTLPVGFRMELLLDTLLLAMPQSQITIAFQIAFSKTEVLPWWWRRLLQIGNFATNNWQCAYLNVIYCKYWQSADTVLNHFSLTAQYNTETVSMMQKHHSWIKRTPSRITMQHNSLLTWILHIIQLWYVIIFHFLDFLHLFQT